MLRAWPGSSQGWSSPHPMPRNSRPLWARGTADSPHTKARVLYNIPCTRSLNHKPHAKAVVLASCHLQEQHPMQSSAGSRLQLFLPSRLQFKNAGCPALLNPGSSIVASVLEFTTKSCRDSHHLHNQVMSCSYTYERPCIFQAMPPFLCGASWETRTPYL